MTATSLKRLVLVCATLACALTTAIVSTQGPGGPPPQGAPAAPGGGGGGGRGRGGLPGATPAQTQAIVEMNVALASLTTAVTTARNELATATFADPRNDAGLKAAVDKLRTAELALATKRAEEFEKLQAGPNKLNAEQVAALVAAGGNVGGGGRGGAGPGRGRGGA
jgi:Spy/CpxP family protein refolding chaperone